MGNLITQIEKGTSVEARTRTLVTGLARGAQDASKNGTMPEWAAQTSRDLDNYATAVAGTGGQGEAAGAGAGGKTGR